MADFRGKKIEVKSLGCKEPTDHRHLERFPYSSIQAETVSTVEDVLFLPKWHWSHDQGYEGSCVGHACAMERAITNTVQNRLLRVFRGGRRYDPLHIWNEAKRIDEWPDTNPGDDNGTSVRAAYEVLRVQGARRIAYGGVRMEPGKRTPTVTDLSNAPSPAEGVETYRWAQSVDEMRTALAEGKPIVIGVPWYSNFDRPQQKRGGRATFGRTEWWVGEGDLGRVRGGHAVVIYGASDERQAFKFKNSWGRGYPLCWLPYGTMGQLLNSWGEACIITDR